ncbi:MAG: 16S rRNA (cytidine(1402)-2'-O)-methyltransferase [Lentisphaerae bacterium]|nr:16S rRNA (cytidine(1402)-2'-O)-methyltransferase [Lentisphaerota bacterium]
MLYIVATPIGNLDDISARALDALRRADVLACEDTRRTRALLAHYGIPRPARVLCYREQNEAHMAGRLADLAAEGLAVAVCSDSGYPGISDPGYRLLSLAVERGLDFTVLPGASAVPVALLLSGLPASSYTFKGYPPRKPGPRRRFFEDEKDRPHTLVVFESPYRAADTLGAALEVLGDRRAAVCVELTKKFERVMRGYLGELRGLLAGRPPRGEVTLVIAGNHPAFRRAEREGARAGAEPQVES